MISRRLLIPTNKKREFRASLWGAIQVMTNATRHYRPHANAV